MTKFFALAIALTILPLGYLVWYWKDLPRWSKFAIGLYVLIMLACLYPIGKFHSSFLKVEAAFPNDCDTASSLSKEYVRDTYPDFFVSLIRTLYGFTPRYYFLSTIGVCELKKENYGKAIAAFEELLESQDFADEKSRRQIENALLRARARVSE